MPRTYFTPHTTQSIAEPITGATCPTTPSNIYEACEYIIDHDDTAAIWFIRNNQITADTPDILTDNLREILGYISTLYPAGNIAVKTRQPNDMPAYNDAIWLNATHIYTLNANHTYDIIAPQNNLYWRNKTAYKSYASYTTPRNTTSVQQPTTPRNNINIHNNNPDTHGDIQNIHAYIDEHIRKHIERKNTILVPDGTPSTFADLPITSKNTEQLYPFMENEMYLHMDTLVKCVHATDTTIINHDTSKYKLFPNVSTMFKNILDTYHQLFTMPLRGENTNIICIIMKYVACTVLSEHPGYIHPKQVLNMLATHLYRQVPFNDVSKCTELFVDITGKKSNTPEYLEMMYTMLEHCISTPDIQDIENILNNAPLNIITPEHYPRLRAALPNNAPKEILYTLESVSPDYPWTNIVTQ